ncbi:hypothetical protein O9993_10260 [Vibrio lentus]|nr:hypothetical protein [Vibrio lentus]
MIIKSGAACSKRVLHLEGQNRSIDEDLLLSTERPISQARLVVGIRTHLSLCPELGGGHFNAPGIEGHREGRGGARL